MQTPNTTTTTPMWALSLSIALLLTVATGYGQNLIDNGGFDQLGGNGPLQPLLYSSTDVQELIDCFEEEVQLIGLLDFNDIYNLGYPSIPVSYADEWQSCYGFPVLDQGYHYHASAPNYALLPVIGHFGAGVVSQEVSLAANTTYALSYRIRTDSLGTGYLQTTDAFFVTFTPGTGTNYCPHGTPNTCLTNAYDALNDGYTIYDHTVQNDNWERRTVCFAGTGEPGRINFFGQNGVFDPVPFAESNGGAGWEFHFGKRKNRTTATAVALDNVVLREFSVDAGADTIVACDSPVQLGPTNPLSVSNFPVTYTWSPTDYLDDPTSPNPIATVPEDTTVTYTVTLQLADRCTTTDQVTVTSYPFDPVDTITISGPDTLCPSSFVSLTASSGYTDYSWSNGESGPSIFVTTPGVYTVTAYDANGCQHIAQHEVKLHELPIEGGGWTINLCSEMENGHEIGIRGSEPLPDGSTFSWIMTEKDGTVSQFPETTSSLSITQPGDYVLAVTLPNGCSVYYTYTVIIDEPLTTPAMTVPAEFGPPSTVCPGDTVCFTGTYGSTPATVGQKWNFGEGATPSIIHNSNLACVTFNHGGYHTVTYTVSNGCGTQTVSEEVFVNYAVDCTDPVDPKDQTRLGKE